MIKTRPIVITTIIVLSLIFVCVAVCGVYHNYVINHPQNVFEEIYYTQAYHSARMPKGFFIDSDHGFKQKWYEYNGSTLCTSYYEGTATQNIRVIIDCYKSPKKQLIISYYDSEYGQNSSIIYDLNARSLKTESTNISFLYDVLLPAWFDGMGDQSSFSMDDLGSFDIE